MTARLALDTSVAIPLLVSTHKAHPEVVRWWAGRNAALSGHALAETYSVLTRLPGDLRLAPADAVRLLRERFDTPLVLAPETAEKVPELLGDLGIVGGAVYDGMVALAAAEHDAVLGTRDSRARATYAAVGVEIELAVAP